MYLRECAGDPTSLPTKRSGGEPVLTPPQILQRPDVATQEREISEYFVEDTEARGRNVAYRFDPRPDDALADRRAKCENAYPG